MTKSFIDKKSCRTFKLVSRPAEEIEDARAEGRDINPRVFVEVTKNKNPSFDFQNSEDDFYDEEIYENSEPGEAMKYGILFDDRHYDYTKHLKTVGLDPGAVILDAPLNSAPDFKEKVVDDIEPIDLDDPAIKETIEALNDNAFLQQNDFEDDFVDILNQGTSNSESDFVSEEFGELVNDFENHCLGSDDNLEFSSCPEENCPEELNPSPEDNPVNHFNSILSKLMFGDNVRIPDLSDFDSDYVFKEWEHTESEPDDIESCPRSSCQEIKPLLINEIQISKKTGRPIKLAQPQANEEIETQQPKINYGIARPKGEPIEEKKIRKSQAKLFKFERKQAKLNK